MSLNNLSLFHSIDKPFGEIPHLVEESTFMFPFSGSQQLNTKNSHSRLFDNTLHDPFPPEKNFSVYDQSCSKSTMIYNSKVQIGKSPTPRNSLNAYNMSKEEEGLIRVSGDSNTYYPPLRQIMDNCVTSEEDEMHEDTEDLNALLSSDDEHEDDEETSTGHSPSTVISNRFWEPVEENGEEEEVNSFAGRPTTKRRRTRHGPTALGDNDAESVYVDFDNRCHKRFRREKIHEVLRALRGLIPGVEGKDSVVLLDEAVNYLRSLKVKAKALGLVAL